MEYRLTSWLTMVRYVLSRLNTKIDKSGFEKAIKLDAKQSPIYQNVLNASTLSL